MEKTAGVVRSAGLIRSRPGCPEEADDEDPGFRVLSREEALALGARFPPVSLWWVLRVQGLAGMAVIALSLLVGAYPGVVVSAVAGVVAAWLPSALFVWRLTPRVQESDLPAFAQLQFFFWEAVKILCTVALLVAAVAWVRPLNWPALLAGFIVTVKAYSLACWLTLATNRRVKSS